jgi:hypothetical protein
VLLPVAVAILEWQTVRAQIVGAPPFLLFPFLLSFPKGTKGAPQPSGSRGDGSQWAFHR